MAMTLMVERHVIPGAQGSIKRLLRELRSNATRQPGFISGRTVVDAKSPTIFMTISVWASMRVWETWEKNPERQEIIDRINELVQGKPVERMVAELIDTLDAVRASRTPRERVVRLRQANELRARIEKQVSGLFSLSAEEMEVIQAVPPPA